MMELTEKQALAFSMIKIGHSVYVGGQAGSGKSALVTRVMEWAEMTGKVAALTCSTGVACSSYSSILKPMTIHKWSGVGDGRLSGRKIRHLMSADDRLLPAKERILSTEILIIDEISMISRKMFDMIEEVLRVKDPDQPFGGIQVICAGDFLQLPPVRNVRYEDLGEFAFTSPFFCNHRVFLDSVFRQNNTPLIQLVRDLSLGIISREDEDLIISLCREMPLEKDCDVVKLFATNLLVDLYNRQIILGLEGELYSFKSTDTGEEKALAGMVVPSTLWLKVGCKVMLLKNLSDSLVNGLQGQVRGIGEDAVRVFFPGVQELITIKRFTFTVFDPIAQRNLSERHQFPLKLSYAMTIHKSQGMSLDRVDVDCRHIFQPGQLGVAVGRCKSVDGLRIRNFSPEAVIPQPTSVAEFVTKYGRCFLQDCSCCTTSVYYSDTEVELPMPLSVDPEPQLHHEVLDIEDEDDMNDPELDHLLANIVDPSEQYSVVLPETFDMHEQLAKLFYSTPVTAQQFAVNRVIDILLQSDEAISHFLNLQFHHCLEFYKTTVPDEQNTGKSVPQAHLTSFYQLWQTHMSSAAYKGECLLLFPLCPNETQSAVYSVAFKLCTALRQLLLSDKAAQLSFDNSTESSLRGTEDMSSTVRGKIRYIGGYAVAKLKYSYSCQMRSNMYQTSAQGVSKFETASKMIGYLEKMSVSEYHLNETTNDPDSLCETSRKQNINRGLTNISDQSYSFFENVINISLQELNSKNLIQYGDSLHTHVLKTIEDNEKLYNHFNNICTGDVLTTSNYNDSIRILFKECTYKVSSILLKQYTKDVMDISNVKKKMEHRKQIQVSSTKNSKKGTNEKSLQQPSTSGTNIKKSTKKATKKSLKQPSTSGRKRRVSNKENTDNTMNDKVDNTDDEGDIETTHSDIHSKKKRKQATFTETHINDTGDSEDDGSCFKCGNIYIDGEDWIACDSCNQWYHRKCCGLSSVKRWNIYKKANKIFCCPQCE